MKLSLINIVNKLYEITELENDSAALLSWFSDTACLFARGYNLKGIILEVKLYVWTVNKECNHKHPCEIFIQFLELLTKYVHFVPTVEC